MKKILLATLLACPLLVNASDDLSYSYLSAGATYLDPDGFDGESGYAFDASGAVSDNWHVFGSYGNTDLGDADFANWNIGLGYNMELTDGLDLVIRASYEKIEVDFIDPIAAPSFSDEGFGLRAGVRNSFNERFEGGAGLAYTNFDGSDNTAVYANAQFKFGNGFGVLAEITASDDGHSIFVGPRFSF